MPKMVKVGVAILLWNEEGQLLMGKRKASHGAGSWSVPGGHIDFGETPREACIREVEEEIGVELDEVLVLQEYPYNNTIFSEGKQYITLWFCGMLSDDQVSQIRTVEPDKCEEWIFCDTENLPTPLFGTGLAELFYQGVTHGV
jgi:8-oxo-dGTP diphosphatase